MGNHIFFIIDAFTGCDYIDTEFVKIDGVIFPYSVAAGSTIPIRDYKTYIPFASKLRKQSLHAVNSSLSDNFSKK